MSNWPGHFPKTEKREAASGLASTIAMEAGQTFPLLERKNLENQILTKSTQIS